LVDIRRLQDEAERLREESESSEELEKARMIQTELKAMLERNDNRRKRYAAVRTKETLVFMSNSAHALHSQSRLGDTHPVTVGGAHTESIRDSGDSGIVIEDSGPGDDDAGPYAYGGPGHHNPISHLVQLHNQPEQIFSGYEDADTMGPAWGNPMSGDPIQAWRDPPNEEAMEESEELPPPPPRLPFATEKIETMKMLATPAFEEAMKLIVSSAFRWNGINQKAVVCKARHHYYEGNSGEIHFKHVDPTSRWETTLPSIHCKFEKLRDAHLKTYADLTSS
jgi:hypothetical protein